MIVEQKNGGGSKIQSMGNKTQSIDYGPLRESKITRFKILRKKIWKD
jgi:hypothetical protein